MCVWVGGGFRTNKEMIQDIKIKEMAQNPNQMAGLWATAANSPLPAQDLQPSVTKKVARAPHICIKLGTVPQPNSFLLSQVQSAILP